MTTRLLILIMCVLIHFTVYANCRSTFEASEDGKVHTRSKRSTGSTGILIGAFNVRVFGVTKMSKPDVVTRLVQIVARYDIVLIQEIRDKSQQAIADLLDAVNQAHGSAFSMVISGRLGRTTSKEQYAYFYRHAVVSVKQDYQYNDETNDDFEREPYGVLFTHEASQKVFGLVGLHSKPDDAEDEIDNLVDVYDDIVQNNNFGTQNIMLMGDFNADCRYVTTTEWPSIRLWTDTRFTWWLSNNVDTTVYTTTDCAYDRLVSAGPDINDWVVAGSAKTYDFEKELGLTHEEARAVSDHFPVEFKLSFVASKVSVSASTSLAGKSLTDESFTLSAYEHTTYSSSGNIAMIVLQSKSLSLSGIQSFISTFTTDNAAISSTVANDEVLAQLTSIDSVTGMTDVYQAGIEYKSVQNGVMYTISIYRYFA